MKLCSKGIVWPSYIVHALPRSKPLKLLACVICSALNPIRPVTFLELDEYIISMSALAFEVSQRVFWITEPKSEKAVTPPVCGPVT